MRAPSRGARVAGHVLLGRSDATLCRPLGVPYEPAQPLSRDAGGVSINQALATLDALSVRVMAG